MRLGFPVRVLGRPSLKPSDTRDRQGDAHLTVSLAYLRDILTYLHQSRIRMYRLSPVLAPQLASPEGHPRADQIAESADELAAAGALAREYGVRLSVHPGVQVGLSSPDIQSVERSVAHLRGQTALLDGLGAGPEAVIVLHAGGVYDDKRATLERLVRRLNALPPPVLSRLALENDERSYSIGDLYAVHRETGVRLVMDHLHDRCLPTPGLGPVGALRLALSTWPDDQVPKVHYSNPSTAFVVGRSSETPRPARKLRAPRTTHHAELIDPFSFIDFLGTAPKLRDFDVMLECRGCDIALLRLRRHLQRFAPQLVRRLGIAQT